MDLLKKTDLKRLVCNLDTSGAQLIPNGVTAPSKATRLTIRSSRLKWITWSGIILHRTWMYLFAAQLKTDISTESILARNSREPFVHRCPPYIRLM